MRIGKAQPAVTSICEAHADRIEVRGRDLVSDLMEHNSARRKRQKKLDIRVIIGNPPYSKGQDSANDNNQNVVYPFLDERIRETYAERSAATNNNSIYDSYIRAFRWASGRSPGRPMSSCGGWATCRSSISRASGGSITRAARSWGS